MESQVVCACREAATSGLPGQYGESRTKDPSFDGDPAWSPDGTRIAFASHRDGNAEIYIMNVDGSGPIHLTNNPAIDLAPAWSSGPTP
jgi:Tol biopolymer transport system component